MGIYRVEKGGQAPAGLTTGDRVVTGGGTYEITGVKSNGKYTSKLVDAGTTIHNYGNDYDTVDSGIPGTSRRTKERVTQMESGYTPSSAVRAAQSYLAGVQGSKPGAYESKWGAELDALYDKITNREKFKYDVYDDPMYQQYKMQYQNLGRTAMMDTMGQAAALTGGYGSSYGQSVGQQTYDAYLQSINDVVPELYGQAYQQYSDEGARMLDQWGLLNDREQQDYSKYRDQMSDYFNELSLAQSAAQAAAQDDYNRWAAERSYWLQKQQDEQSYYAAAQKAASGSRGGKSSGSGSDSAWTEFGAGLSKTMFDNMLYAVKQNAAKGDAQTVDQIMSKYESKLSRKQWNTVAGILNNHGYTLPKY